MIADSSMSRAAAPAPEILREQFLLNPEIAYLNHGSFGACPRPVFENYQHWQLELEREPVFFFQSRSDRLMDEARARLAAEVHCDPDELVYVPNATIGLNIVIRSLDLKPGDEVLTTDQEYGALDLAWEHSCGKAGARYVKQHIPMPLTTPDTIVDALFAGVTDKTKVIFVSHITSPTALTFPVALICHRARELGILSIVDGAHVVGQRPLDLQTLGADVYSSNNHKWLCAPKGSGFLYVRREQQPWVEAMTVSWGWNADWHQGADRVERPQFVRRNQWQGTRDLSPFLATPAAIDFLAANNWDAVRARCHRMASDVRARILELAGTEPLSPDDPEWYAQMVAVPIPVLGEDARAFKQRLFDDYQIEVPVSANQANPDQSLIRVSVQGYNTERDLDRLLEALKQTVPTARA